jgi:hypothetical protein
MLLKGARVRSLPEQLARLGVAGDDLLVILVANLGMKEKSALGHDGRAMALAGGLPPQHARGFFPGTDFFRRGAIAVWAEPLRPIARGRPCRKQHKND